ncbi:MAG: hypothetical protein V3U65_13770 [Granulosicoccaceae bacterium]
MKNATHVVPNGLNEGCHFECQQILTMGKISGCQSSNIGAIAVLPIGFLPRRFGHDVKFFKYLYCSVGGGEASVEQLPDSFNCKARHHREIFKKAKTGGSCC